MNKLFTPLPVTVAIVILFAGLSFTSVAHITSQYAPYFGMMFLVLFIHEAGHALGGKIAGYRFHYLTVGPITIEKSPTFRIKRNDSWMTYGGVASSTPDTTTLGEIIPKHKWFVAGGPLLSLITAICSVVVWFITKQEVAIYFAIFNFIIFIVPIIPYQGAFKSDGRVLLELSKGGESAEAYLLDLMLLKEMMSPAHPSTWSNELIEQALHVKPAGDRTTTAFMLFYFFFMKQGYDKASAVIEPYKQLPVTNKTKVRLQFITHIKQIDVVKQGQFDARLIKKYHQLLSAFEPISYKRSEALVAYANGDMKEAKCKLHEVLAQCEKEKALYGFFYAEQQLTTFLYEMLFPTV
ncbi:hypothetical protein ACFDTO_37930 [Microbacteriaceae bacterium 4G12]